MTLTAETAARANHAITELKVEGLELDRALAADVQELSKERSSGSGFPREREFSIEGGRKPENLWQPTEGNLSVLSWHLREGRMPKHIALDILKTIVKSDVNGLTPARVEEMLTTAYKGESVPEKSLAKEIRAWVVSSSGDFLSSQVVKDLNLSSRVDKKNLSKVLGRLVNEGLIERVSSKHGCFRRIERDAQLLDWRSADASTVLDLKWPFGLERLANLFPGNIIVVAGAPNAGKTALLLNLIRLNMTKHQITYFSSEMGPEELKLRLRNFEDLSPDDWNFGAYDRSSNFADVIQPNAVNIIDYLEVTTDFYKVGGEIKAIHDKLDKGLAVIALQKKRGAELGRGAEFSLEKPRLYLSMDDGELKVIKAKNWGEESKETGQNPNGKVFYFSLVGGCKFVPRYQVEPRKK